MGKALSVCFRVDADERSGLGHLSRCRSLLLTLRACTDAKFSFVSRSQEAINKFVCDVDFNIHSSWDLVKGECFDLVVVDVPDIALKKEEIAATSFRMLVGIDDDGPGVPEQDILIRPNLLDLPRPLGMDDHNYWSGRDYIILHPDFSLEKYRRVNKNRISKELFVCFGGSDPGGITVRVLPLLKSLDIDVVVHLVMGSSFLRKNDVESLIGNDRRFSISNNISNMAQQLSRTDVAFISGGTMLYEVCALGVPAMVLSQNQAQDVESSICHKAGAVVNLGVHQAVSNGEVSAALQRIMLDADFRSGLSENGPRMVAADGARRIVAGLLARLGGVVGT